MISCASRSLHTPIWGKMAEHLGVQYVYADSTLTTAPEPEPMPSELTVEMLETMPLKWVDELHRAAQQIDDEQILKLLEQIPKTHLALANALADLVRNFRCDHIIHLTEQALS